VPVAPDRASRDWPGWRGPRLDGTSAEADVPVRWSATENIAWKTPLPGIGHSSPAIVGDRIFVTTCLLKEQQRVLLCLDRRDGKILWQRVVLTSPLERKHKLNSFASSTPAADGKHVYVAFPKQPDPKVASYEVIISCYNHNGDLVWSKSPGKFYSPHGFCSSPLLYKDKVIVNLDQDPTPGVKQQAQVGYVVALDRATGAEKWRIDRPNRTRSYCAPLIVEAAGKMQLVLSGSKCFASYDPDTGKLHWMMDGPTEQFVASPVYGSGLFFLTAGFPTFHNLAVRPDGSGNIGKTHVAWHEQNKKRGEMASYVPSPIAAGPWFFVVSDLGKVHCFEAKTGQRLWSQKLGDHHSASPVSANGLLYFIADDGVTHVFKASDKFEPVATNDLGEECYSSPAIARGQLFIRTDHHLWCIGANRAGR
jgi:outer membrane protein assembly factor BamB